MAKFDITGTRTLSLQDQVIRIESEIKGYHAFHIRPHVAIEMDVVAEETNQYDPNAMLVVMPDEVDHWLLDEVTRPPPRQQTVKEILGKTVGRVPKKLTDVFAEVIASGMVTHVKW